MKVGVIGIGGLGQIGMRVAVLKGCDVYVATRKPEAQELARSLGAKDVKANIKEFADVGLDVIVDYAGGGVTTADAVETVKYGGRVVIVGMAKDFAEINTMAMITKHVTLVGSIGGDVDDIADCLALMATGQLKPNIETIRFEQIGEGIERLARGEVKGRLVAVYDD